MTIVRCKTNHLVNPLGFDTERVVLSWTVADSVSKAQISARIRVGRDQEFQDLVLDTGHLPNLDNRGFEAPLELEPRRRYFWTVEVVGEADRALSDTNWFETGKRGEDWEASWISPDFDDASAAPCLRKVFKLSSRVVSARAYVVGLGLYEMELNGRRVGQEYFTPHCNAYDAWLQYQSYDITDLLQEGENALGVMLGNGWAKGPFGTFGDMNQPYIDHFAFLGEIRITYADGSSQVIVSDETWRCRPGPVLEDSIYDGEVYDARAEIPVWSESDGGGEAWDAVRVFQPTGLGLVVDRMSPPVLVKEERKPVEVIRTPSGDTVLDMGQNMVGWTPRISQDAWCTRIWRPSEASKPRIPW